MIAHEEKIREAKECIRSLCEDIDEDKFIKNKKLIKKYYGFLEPDLQVKLFKYMVVYPKESEENGSSIDKFEDEIIEKYVLNDTTEYEYLIFFIRNKQKMFDSLFRKYIECNDQRESIFIVSRMIYLFLEFDCELRVSKEQIIKLTRFMDRKLSFVLAAFISKNRDILKGSDYEHIFLPRLDAYLERFGKNKKKIDKMEKSQVTKHKLLDIPPTIQQAIEKIQSGDLEIDCLIFYIFTAQKKVLRQNFNQLLKISLKSKTPLFLVVLSERLSEYSQIADFFFNASFNDKETILNCWLLLKDLKWVHFDDLKEIVKTKLEKQNCELAKENKMLLQRCFNIVTK